MEENQDFGEAIAQKLGKRVTNIMEHFFGKSTEDKLKYIALTLKETRFPGESKKTQIDSLIGITEKVVNDLMNEYKQIELSETDWRHIDEKFAIFTDIYFQQSFHHYFHFIILTCLLSDSSHILSPEYRKEAKEQFNLHSPGKFRDALMKTLEPMFFDEVNRGGSKAFWSDKKKLQFLALYNRYLFVIKNSRKEINRSKKNQNFSIDKISENIEEKYLIPAKYVDGLFLYISNSDLALDWAKQTLMTDTNKKHLSNDDYLRDVLTKARLIFPNEKRRKELETANKKMFLIDINYEIGCRYYAVWSDNKEKIARLKFPPVAKTGITWHHFNNDFKDEEFLVEFNHSR